MVGIEPQLKDLMVRGLDGDAAAHAQLLSALAGFLRAYFARRLNNGSADIEDLVQETLLAVHLKRATFERDQPFTPWAYAMARYKLLDHFRRVGRRQHVPLESAGELFAQDNPEEGAVRRDVAKLLSGLPDRQRKLMEDVKISGLSMEEAATASGMSVAAVKVSVHRSMKALMARVGK